MSAILIRDLPDGVHDALREIARARGLSVETLARDMLKRATNDARPLGIDFDRLARRRKALGMTEDWPEWTEEMDDPALSRRLLGLD